MSEALALVRRWVNDYFNRHDAAAARRFCTTGYALEIGDVVFAGRDDSWLPAVEAQMKAWPGLGMTVHQTVAGDGWAAAWFSEHGASGKAMAAWSGVAVYFAANGWLTGCIAQEDYMTRRRQVKSGEVDPIAPPCPAPWDTPVRPANPKAEAVVRSWLEGGWPRADGAVACDDEHITGQPLTFDVSGIERCLTWSSGDQVVFYARQRGTYRDGLPSPAAGSLAQTIDVNGIVTVQEGRVTGGRVIRDRMGLWARCRTEAGQ